MHDTSPIVPVRFGLIGSAAGKYRGKHNCSSAGKKKKRRIRGTSGFIAKIFVYRDYFQAPAAYTHSYQPHLS